jgi:hypothetical protein
VEPRPSPTIVDALENFYDTSIGSLADHARRVVDKGPARAAFAALRLDELFGLLREQRFLSEGPETRLPEPSPGSLRVSLTSWGESFVAESPTVAWRDMALLLYAHQVVHPNPLMDVLTEIAVPEDWMDAHPMVSGYPGAPLVYLYPKPSAFAYLVENLAGLEPLVRNQSILFDREYHDDLEPMGAAFLSLLDEPDDPEVLMGVADMAAEWFILRGTRAPVFESRRQVDLFMKAASAIRAAEAPGAEVLRASSLAQLAVPVVHRLRAADVAAIRERDTFVLFRQRLRHAMLAIPDVLDEASRQVFAEEMRAAEAAVRTRHPWRLFARAATPRVALWTVGALLAGATLGWLPALAGIAAAAAADVALQRPAGSERAMRHAFLVLADGQARRTSRSAFPRRR